MKLSEEKRALTEGQYAVFVKDKECLGSAKIKNTGVSSFSYNYLQSKELHVKNECKDKKIKVLS